VVSLAVLASYKTFSSIRRIVARAGLVRASYTYTSVGLSHRPPPPPPASLVASGPRALSLSVVRDLQITVVGIQVELVYMVGGIQGKANPY
jgi:hypothetical protein